jgi:tRNA (mo5U34)-methyltransferase
MNTELKALFDQIYWHQRWEIMPGIFTPGHNPVSDLMRFSGIPNDLRGKRILDIGAWNGCFSFECERRGASEVLALGPESSEATGFDRIKLFLGSKAQYKQGTVYHLHPDDFGKFDIVICFGVIYHLRYPLLALDMMRRVCLTDLFMETAGLDENTIVDGSSYQLSQLAPKLTNIAISQFYRGSDLNNDSTNWFGFNEKCVIDMLLSSGFNPIMTQRFGHRIAAHAKVIPGAPEWFRISGEGVYYDIITRPILGRPDVY